MFEVSFGHAVALFGRNNYISDSIYGNVTPFIYYYNKMLLMVNIQFNDRKLKPVSACQIWHVGNQ